MTEEDLLVSVISGRFGNNNVDNKLVDILLKYDYIKRDKIIIDWYIVIKEFSLSKKLVPVGREFFTSTGIWYEYD